MFRLCTLTIVAAVMCSSAGCNMLPNSRNAFRQLTRTFTPTPRDYDDGSDESGSEWAFVGEEGRADQQREVDPDPWFKQMFMSEKANAIERNLGYD